METKFESFPKMGRLSREVIVTEKIDGTNGQIYIEGIGPDEKPPDDAVVVRPDGLVMMVGSRTRWITPGKNDNFGFAGWCKEHASELFTLGTGRHFGEWWGAGIQRRYGLESKRFSLFNAQRWTYLRDDVNDKREILPTCCHVVPTLWKGTFDTGDIRAVLNDLEINGSQAAPGFMKPEGIVIYHIAGNVGFKKTIEGDEFWKGKTNDSNKT